ncbi:MAG TPA: Hint domain-containing protein, partial [Vampirovibrionales bacterium]
MAAPQPPKGGARTPRYKNIEDIRIGDKVLSWNEDANKVEAQEVEKTFIRKAERILIIILEDGTKIETTPDHPFYVKSKGWVEAGTLTRRDVLLDTNLKEKKIITFDYQKGTTVYNFTVANTHTYFAHNILVHNNDYSASDAERFNELAGELKLQKQELIPIPATEEIVLKGSA